MYAVGLFESMIVFGESVKQACKMITDIGLALIVANLTGVATLILLALGGLI